MPEQRINPSEVLAYLSHQPTKQIIKAWASAMHTAKASGVHRRVLARMGECSVELVAKTAWRPRARNKTKFTRPSRTVTAILKALINLSQLADYDEYSETVQTVFNSIEKDVLYKQ